MAIYRGSGGSVEGITESDTVVIAVAQGGTGAKTAAQARTNLGIGSIATSSSADFATALQGTKADTAVQPEDLGAVATSNSYDDLNDLPTLGTAAATDSADYATAAQGALADTATQPGDLATVATTGAYSDLTGKPSLSSVATSGSYNDLSNKPTIPTTLDGLSDVVITSVSTGQLLKFNGTEWVNATVGGAGTVTSVDMSVPTGLSVSGNPVTSAGTLAVTYASGYAIPTTAKQTEWDTAYTDRNKWDGGATGLTAATGRTSLGLGTAATTAATDYATAAQGVKADNALPATNPSYTGTLTGGTGVVNLGSGQLYKDSSGNVGIGTSSPSFEVEVSKSKAGAVTNLVVSNPDNTGGAALKAYSQSGVHQAVLGITDAGSDGRVGTISNDSFYFVTNNTERGRFDTSGNFLFNSGYGSVATAYGCRAWVNFNGTGTVAIRGDGNVDTITDVGTGRYTVNFTSAMPDANYAVVATCNQATTGNAANNSFGLYATATDGSTGVTRTTTAVQLQAKYGVSSTVQDIAEAHVAIFR